MKHRREFLICLALTLAVFLVYIRALRNGFIDFDDSFFVTQNTQVKKGLSWEGFQYAWTALDGFWHPLTWLSLELDYHFYGLKHPAGFHSTNMLLHTANALLLFWVLRWTTAEIWPSSAVAALFAIHPLNVESAAWVSERKGLICAFFGFLALLAYVRYVERPGWRRYLVILFAFVGSLMAKSMFMTFPFILLLLDYWPLKRFSSAVLGRLILEKIPLLAFSVIILALTVVAEEKYGALRSFSQVPLDQRISNALVSYVLYISKAIWPVNLAPFYPHPGATLAAWQPVAAGLMLLAITVLVVRARRDRPYLMVGWFWFVGMLVPVIGLVSVGRHGMADRYTYLPMIGLFILGTWSVADLARRCQMEKFALGAAGCLLAAFMAVTWNQIGFWKDEITLWNHTLKATDPTRNQLAHYNLALALSRDHQPAQALNHYQQALRIDPALLRAHVNLAELLFQKGEWDNAEFHLNKALEINSRDAMTWNNLGALYWQRRQPDRAVAAYEKALECNPSLFLAHSNLAMIFLKGKQLDQAIEHFQEMIRLAPGNSMAHYGLGRALAQQGNWDRAIEAFAKAVEIEPENLLFRSSLGWAWYHQGEKQLAANHYREAFIIKPRWPEDALWEAWKLAVHPDPKQRDGQQAVEWAEQACQATELVRSRSPRFLDTLAAAYAEAGRFPKAVESATKAIEGLPSDQKDLRNEIETRLKLYQAGKAYTDSQIKP